MITQKISNKARRIATRLSAICVTLGIVMAPSAASAAQAYSVSVASAAGIHDGNLTFWTNGTDFKADIYIWDGAPDYSGVNAYFHRTFASGANWTRKIYWGGGYQSWGTFPNEVFTSGSRVKQVGPIACLTDNGDEWTCQVDWPYLTNPNF